VLNVAADKEIGDTIWEVCCWHECSLQLMMEMSDKQHRTMYKKQCNMQLMRNVTNTSRLVIVFSEPFTVQRCHSE